MITVSVTWRVARVRPLLREGRERCGVVVLVRVRIWSHLPDAQRATEKGSVIRRDGGEQRVWTDPAHPPGSSARIARATASFHDEVVEVLIAFPGHRKDLLAE